MKYHVLPGFSPKASGFYPFGDATALAGESGVGDVVWMIQAPTSNQKIRPFGLKEPSLWFVVCGLLEISHAAALTTGAKHWHR